MSSGSSSFQIFSDMPSPLVDALKVKRPKIVANKVQYSDNSYEATDKPVPEVWIKIGTSPVFVCLFFNPARKAVVASTSSESA